MHVLDKFRYCPVCGSKHFVVQNEKSKRCESCGFEYFLNPSSAVAAFILNKEGELLVTRRKYEPGRGTLDLPGGFCDIGETIGEALIREVKEETTSILRKNTTSVHYRISIDTATLISQHSMPSLSVRWWTRRLLRLLMMWKRLSGRLCQRFILSSLGSVLSDKHYMISCKESSKT